MLAGQTQVKSNTQKLLEMVKKTSKSFALDEENNE